MRLFVAVWPPAGVLDLLDSLPQPALPGVRWTPREQRHTTLRFLGEVADEVAADLGDAIAARLPPGPIAAALGPASELLNPRIVSVPVSGLDGVATAVLEATADVGRPPERRPFRGHVTLARLKGVPARTARPLAGVAVEAAWPVREVAVVRSRLSPHGARYETVAAVPLAR